MAACPASTRSLFVRAAPTDVNEFVIRARRSLRDQAMALGLAVGGRIPRVLPDEKTRRSRACVFSSLFSRFSDGSGGCGMDRILRWMLASRTPCRGGRGAAFELGQALLETL